MTTTELQELTNNVCLVYTKAKFPKVFIDAPLLLRRIGEEYAELAEEMSSAGAHGAIAAEIADILNTVFMLASHLNMDVETIMKSKLEVLRDRTDKLRKTGSY